MLCLTGLFGGMATAATYTLPNGTLPASCTKASNTSVTCSNNLSLDWGDAIVVSNANLTLTINKTLTLDGSNNLNTSTTVSGFAIQAKTVTGSKVITLKGNLNATDALTLSSNTNNITGNVSAGSNITIGGSVTGTLVAGGDLTTMSASTITGNATAGGKIVSGGGSTYGGNLVASGDITSGSGDKIAGSVTSSAGAATLKSSGTTVGGNVSAKNAVILESGSTVAGSVTSSNNAVTLASSGTTVGNGVTAKGAVTLGSSCTVTGDVVTDDTVTLESSSSKVIGNISAKKKVTLGSSTSVTGNVTTINSDVELKDSNGSVSGCVTVDSTQTLKLGWGTSVGGVCCLSTSGTCSATGCVVNGSGNAAPGVCAAAPATLIAQWHFEEATDYTGAAGELQDSAGYAGGPYNGVAIGNPLPAVNGASPARAGNPGTCSYATPTGPVANGGAFSVDGLPVSLADGAKTSVAFWMYWDGTNGVMPIGWNVHDLWLADGYFGFNTGNNDLFGVASTGLANGWHHVVAVFTNGSVSGNQLYLDGVSQTLSKWRSSSPSLASAKVSANLRIGGWAVDTGYRFSGRIDEVKLYNGAVTQAQVSADFAQTHACQATTDTCLPPVNLPAGVSVTCVCDNFNRTTLNPSTIFGADWLATTSDGSGILPRIVNPGYLRLTENTGNNAKAVSVPGIFPAAGNYISVEFKHYAYAGSGADGIAVTLSDYATPAQPGAYGGSLGYAQKNTKPPCPTTGCPGFAGGWLGVAIDEFGNFQNPNEGRIGGPGRTLDSVSVRGSGSGQTGYQWLKGTMALSPGIDSPSSATPAPGYTYQVIVDARANTGSSGAADVTVNRNTGSGYSPLIPTFDIQAAATAQSTTQAAVPTNWQISLTGSTGGSTNFHEIGALKICAQTIIPPNGGVLGGFNVIDSAIPSGTVNALQGHIYTKLASTPFTLNVAALNATSSGIETTYAFTENKNVTVELFDDSAGTSCNASTGACAACSKSVVTSQSMIFAKVDKGFKTSADFTVPNAYSRLIARVKDATGTPTLYGCSTDAFAVRPGVVTLTPTLATATGPSASATPVVKAGSNFTLRATTSTNASDGYSGALSQNTGAMTAQITTQDTTRQNGGVVGSLTPTSLIANAAAVNATYSEVGYLYLAADAYRDTTFTAVDQNGDCVANNTSITLSGNKYGCVIGNTAEVKLGRFIPDHFVVTTGAPFITPRSDINTCSTSTFTYLGEPFTLNGITLTAMPGGGSNPTKNYMGAFAKLDLSSDSANVSNLAAGAQHGTAPSFTNFYNANATANRLVAAYAGTSFSDTYPSTDPDCPGIKTLAWCKGKAVMSLALTAKRATGGPDGPFAGVVLGISPVDSDLVKIGTPDFQRDYSGTGALAADGKILATMSGNELRFGRLRLQNAFGSERLPLNVPIQAQYWNGNSFVVNADDSCTALTMPEPKGAPDGSAGRFYAASSKNELVTPNPVPVFNNIDGTLATPPKLGGGKANLRFPEPLKRGWLDITLGVDSWLQFNWGNCNDQAGASSTNLINNPCARATFGIYKSGSQSSPIIYRRENY